jgi:hypothetical protein
MTDPTARETFWRDTKYLTEQREAVELIDNILEEYRDIMKEDFLGYRNHCQRVFAFYLYLLPEPYDPSVLQMSAIAVAFHDIGIWTDSTVDYIDPSRKVARDYLVYKHLNHWINEVDLMIERHHQILQGELEDNSTSNVFRKADLADFSLGFVPNGVPVYIIRELQAAYPNEGFHTRLMQLALGRLWTHPFSPAPMMRWS